MSITTGDAEQLLQQRRDEIARARLEAEQAAEGCTAKELSGMVRAARDEKDVYYQAIKKYNSGKENSNDQKTRIQRYTAAKDDKEGLKAQIAQLEEKIKGYQSTIDMLRKDFDNFDNKELVSKLELDLCRLERSKLELEEALPKACSRIDSFVEDYKSRVEELQHEFAKRNQYFSTLADKAKERKKPRRSARNKKPSDIFSENNKCYSKREQYTPEEWAKLQAYVLTNAEEERLSELSAYGTSNVHAWQQNFHALIQFGSFNTKPTGRRWFTLADVEGEIGRNPVTAPLEQDNRNTNVDVGASINMRARIAALAKLQKGANTSDTSQNADTSPQVELSKDIPAAPPAPPMSGFGIELPSPLVFSVNTQSTSTPARRLSTRSCNNRTPMRTPNNLQYRSILSSSHRRGSTKRRHSDVTVDDTPTKKKRKEITKVIETGSAAEMLKYGFNF